MADGSDQLDSIGELALNVLCCEQAQLREKRRKWLGDLRGTHERWAAAAPRGVTTRRSPTDDEGERRPRLSHPRNAEVRPLAAWLPDRPNAQPRFGRRATRAP